VRKKSSTEQPSTELTTSDVSPVMTRKQQKYVPYIRWKPGQVFPDYRDVSGSFVSRKRIRCLQPLAENVLRAKEAHIAAVMRNFAQRRHGRGVCVSVDIDAAISKLRNVTFTRSSSDTAWAESDGTQIWIYRHKMSDEKLLGLLLHESLHCIATINRQDICMRDEHRILRQLGDTCEL
jgi:hypothetical protein